MKRLKFYLAFVAVAAMFMTSCSKEENQDAPIDGEEMGSLNFKALLQNFDSKTAVKQSETPGTENNGLPECPQNPGDALFVRVQLLDADGNIFEKEGESFFDVPVIPQDDGTWLTGEGEMDELELPQGEYSLNYFAVHGGPVNALDPTIYYIAPRENADYGPAEYDNFVTDALPSEPFAVMNGQKKYVDVEVLCYDDHFVQKYGYLFFDFEEVDILYLCLFGNVCDEDGRHAPAVFRFDAYNYSGDDLNPKGTKLFSAQNELLQGADLLDQIYDYAEPVCVQLPDDADEIDMYYGEVWLLHGEGVEDDELIRWGAFDENSVEDLYISDADSPGDSQSNYYHFREDCGGADDSEPCLFKDLALHENDFNDGEKFLNNGVETGTQYEEGLITEGWVPGGTSADEDAPLWLEGTYSFTSNPNDVHNHWLDMDYGNDFFILNGDTDSDVQAYFSITQDDVCPGMDYFVAFDILNVFDGASPSNDIRLVAEVDGTPLDDDDQIIVVPYNGGDWLRVALRVKANASGQLDIKFIDDNTVASGNDFALDNVVISNDPGITSPHDIEVIQD